MFEGASGPPHASGTTWSFTEPGHAPLVRPVAGQGCVCWKSHLTEAERGCLAEAEIGSATEMSSKTQMRRTILIVPKLAHGPPAAGHRLSQCSGPVGVVFSSCPIAAIIRRQTASPALSAASASSADLIALSASAWTPSPSASGWRCARCRFPGSCPEG